MSARFTLLASAALLAVVPAAGAQEKKTESRGQPGLRVYSERDCKAAGDGTTTCTFGPRIDSVLAKRAALGIQLSSTGSLRDTLGVFVSRVTPKGPAENAGVVEGDRIVSINGVDLRLNAADAGDSYASGLASRRLTRELRKASPGARVNLRVWSGGRVRDVQVTAGSAADLRERGSLGLIFDGMGDAMTMIGRMPHLRIESFPRIKMQSFDRTRLNDFPLLRREHFPHMDLEDLPKIELEKKLRETPKEKRG
ncbi:MAG: PDZ domain-containing protein [Gemmatimonadaceae bacterium]